MLHVNIFIVMGSLCAGLCDIAAALSNLYYVLESTQSILHFFLFLSGIFLERNWQIKRGRVSAQVPKYLLHLLPLLLHRQLFT